MTVRVSPKTSNVKLDTKTEKTVARFVFGQDINPNHALLIVWTMFFLSVLIN